MKWPKHTGPNTFTFCHTKKLEKVWIWKRDEQPRGPGAAARLLCMAMARKQIGSTGSNQMTEEAKTKLERAGDPVPISSHTGTVVWGVIVVPTHANRSGKWPPVRAHAEGKGSFAFRHDSKCTVWESIKLCFLDISFQIKAQFVC